MRLALAAILALSATPVLAQPLTTAFNFQGDLNNGPNPASGLYDFKFTLFDAATAGAQVGAQLCSDNINVSAGRVSVQLDFGAQFSGQQRFLEVQVRQDTGLNCSDGTGFATLSPRTNLLAEPNALFSLSAAAATNATQLNGQTPSFYQNASNLTTGTIPTGRLSGIYGNVLTLSNPSNAFVGSGTSLSALNATNVSLGTLPDARLSANIARLNTPNSFNGITNSFLGSVGIGTASPGSGMALTVAGNMEMGANSGDYRHFRIGGGNSDGFLYGSYPAFGDGIHMGYNFYANSAGSPVIIHSDGQTSRITTGYGYIALATGSVGQAPINHVDVDQYGTLHVLNAAGNFDAASYYSDPSPSPGWPQGTYPFGLPFNSAGAIALYSPVGSVRFGVRSRFNQGTSVFPNQGELYMDDSTGTDRISIEVSGEGGASSGFIGCTNLFVTGTKSFITPHPDHPDTDIIYYCIEGPEAAMYLRGTSHLTAGRAHVDLPDTFSSIASKDGITVILTPLSTDSRGLACVNRSITGFDVGELLQGDGSYDFDWEIKAVRRGLRDIPVTAPWTEHAHGDKPTDVLWHQRQSDIEARAAKFAKEDEQLGARP
jgi:hypothetical protein